ncbi:MAG TPA: hypothetical protein EYP56_18555 [Planctomycetaceae bacterium]|nr:hypothetical protein [Planctomycetaceae bacterium]HIQ20608.1 hypothetical protein [Planctomycetota bacterium]
MKLTRPDGSFRTWWHSKPDDNALADPALEFVLPQAAEPGEIAPELLAPQTLPGLWPREEITAQTVAEYFNGSNVAQVKKDGYEEPVPIPKAGQEVVDKAISEAVGKGVIWLRFGPASVLG